MINIKFLLGLFSKTNDIEANEAALLNEFAELQQYAQSEDLKHFIELQQIVESAEFKAKEKEIKSIVYINSPEFIKEQEFLKLQKSAGIKNYYKVLNAPEYANYKSLNDSAELKKHEELRKVIESETFIKNKAQIKAIVYKGTEAQLKEQEYNLLLKNKDINNYYKILDSENYKLYNQLYNTERIKEFEALKTNAESATIKQLEKDIKSAKFESTDAFKKLSELNTIKKSANFKKYQEIKSSEAYSIYNQLNENDTFKHFLDLQQQVQTEEFIKVKTEAGKTFNTTDAFNIEKEYLSLKGDKHIQTYLKFVAANHHKIVEDFENTDILAKVQELENFITSDEFKKTESYYKQNPEIRWQQHAEYANVKKYIDQKNNPEISAYYKFINSKEFTLFLETQKSGNVEKFEKLKELVTSAEFIKEKEYMLLPFETKWQQTNESKSESEYIQLSKKPELINYFKFIASAPLKMFNDELANGNVAQYEELQKFVSTDEFKQQKNYLLQKPEVKWQQADEYKQLQEYNNLKNSEKIKWYYKVYQSAKFDELKRWKITFEDNFDNSQIDVNKWLTRYYYGDQLLNDTYSLMDDKHFVTDGKNLKVWDSTLCIETRSEKAEGKAWHPLLGFVPKQFEYTSGHINTGKSFRQKQGRFRAKIKLSDNKAITHSFCLVGNSMLPQIDIVKYNNGKWYLGNFWGNITEKNGVKKNIDNISASKLCNDYYIFELEWNATSITWKINNLVIKTQNTGIPDEPMYIAISSGIYSDNNAPYPAKIEIDWVKCYTVNE